MVSSMSNASGVTVTGTTETPEETILSIHPNPANDFLQIEFSSKSVGSVITIYDLAGKEIQSKSVTGTLEKIDISRLAKGTYWISIAGLSQTSRKFVVDR